MGENAKRLGIKVDVLRELYMKSGNQCAFPDCHHSMIDDSGNFVGQICHIEAASEGGPRFNPKMTDEDRRSFDNLILLCYDHHKKTDDVIKYPVEKLKEMKRAHEAKYSDIEAKMRNSIEDYGVTLQYKKSVTCKKLAEDLQYGLTEEENRETAEVLNRIIDKLRDVPVGTRKLLSIMVSRSYSPSRLKRWQHGECTVSLSEIEEATGKDGTFIMRHLENLIRHNIVLEPYWDEAGCPFCDFVTDATGWNYWNDIRAFCIMNDYSLERVCVDLDLSIFDE
ncbi:MAG: hypothetical protein KH921_09395 [Erysipelotrichaceae bacterium]|nr:hypothetical protein [Erysipelotrichaceae bacterium]